MDNNKKDEYLVYIRNDGTKFYYKNKLLHREVGPAIVKKDKDEYVNLSDKNLYAEVFKPVVYGDGISNINRTIKYQDKIIIVVEEPIIFNLDLTCSIYWLNGIEYSEKEFNSIMLKQKIEKELKQQDFQDKITKI